MGLLEWLVVLFFVWTGFSVLELCRSFRDLYDDFGCVRYDVYPVVRRNVISVAVKGVVTLSLVALALSSWAALSL